MTFIKLLETLDANTEISKITVIDGEIEKSFIPKLNVLNFDRVKSYFKYRVVNIHCIAKNKLWVEINYTKGKRGC